VYGFRTDPQAARETRGLRIRLACANLIEGTASAHDAALSKPAPEIVQAALRKSGGDARAAIMIGDTPYDVEAALRADVHVITVRCGGFWSDADFRGSLSTFNDPGDILAHYEILSAASTLQSKSQLKVPQ